MIKAGIVGGAGYTGGELIRLLMGHESITIDQVASSSQAGKAIGEVHQDLAPFLKQCFVESIDHQTIDVLFLCSGHGKAKEYVASHDLPQKLRIIDLSHDFRVGDRPDGFHYGLPEAYKSRILESQRIANPGCFATAIQLALLPLADAHVLLDDVHVTAVTGSTGAGQQPTPSTHFSWRSNNISVYKSFNHQHLAEIEQTIKDLQPSFESKINFVPVRGPFTRGILASVHCRVHNLKEDVQAIFEDYYDSSPFVHVVDKEPDLKMIVNTNHCFISAKQHDEYVHVVAVLDNVIKGAVGQAVQNCNLMFGIEEQSGLNLKPSIY